MVAFLVSLALLAAAPAAGAQTGNGSRAVAAPAGGIPLPVDGHWYLFSWVDDGYSPVFTFTTTDEARLRVTDAFCRGDVFEIYDNGVLIGSTPVVPADEDCDERQPRKPGGAFRDPTYSHGVLQLGAGDHSVQLLAVVNFFGSGDGYLGAAQK
jgi:hypothetical protein